MPTYRLSSRNQLRTPLGAVGDAPDVPGYLASLTDDIDAILGVSGVEYVATSAARDAIPGTRIFDDKLVKTADNGVIYAWGNAQWRQWSSDWRAFTPTFGGFTLGNGTVNSNTYRYQAGLMLIRLQVALGSTSAMTGPLLITLPQTPSSTDFLLATGVASHSGVNYPLLATVNGGTQIRLRAQQVSGSNIIANELAATVPFTWASGDTFSLTAAIRMY